MTVLSAEDILPYDRTLLTKALPMGDVKGWGLRSSDFLKGGDIEYSLGKKVTGVDSKKK